ncbi:peptide transporter, partial [Francisella tularensis subsp. holarctica]|nr:peptide transporter [Francisella tularensis subsp. holarctica]
CINVGSSLFKPAPTKLISRIYTDKLKLDSVYTYFYMSINMISLSASLLIPVLATKYVYTAAYGVCSVGFAIGILNSLL